LPSVWQEKFQNKLPKYVLHKLPNISPALGKCSLE
jgi:hypothetical protein